MPSRTLEVSPDRLAAASLGGKTAALIDSVTGSSDPALRKFLLFLFLHNAEGHVCLMHNASNTAGDLKILFSQYQTDYSLEDELTPDDLDFGALAAKFPDAIGSESEFKPVIISEEGAFYFQKYFRQEKLLAEMIASAIKRRSSPLLSAGEATTDRAGELFGSDATIEQMAQRAASYGLTVVTGGPGTGKTSAVVKILSFLFMKAQRIPVCLLCAPTGKAAARLRESVAEGKKRLAGKAASEILDNIPEQASTIHRLLGINPANGRARHNENNPLPVDIIVVDESSMLDQQTALNLFSALPRQCSIIMVGDANQLSPVETGAVFKDLCEAIDPVGKNSEYGLYKLIKNYRAAEALELLEVAKLVLAGDAPNVLKVLSASESGLVQYDQDVGLKKLAQLLDKIADGHAEATLSLTPESIDSFVSRSILLTPLKNGLFGSLALNKRIEAGVKKKLEVDPRTEWYHGRMVMVLRNTGAFSNGDIGVCVQRNGELRVYFSRGGGVESCLPIMLPEHEPAYALTVHKSQGGEYNHADLLLPEADSAVLTRELLYTAITRVRRSLRIIGGPVILQAMIKRTTTRETGLAEMIRKLLVK